MIEPPRGTRREPGVDVFRGIAVLLMFVVHARRLQAPGTHRGVERVAGALLDAVLWAEPVISASFLGIVGVSLVLAHRPGLTTRRWFRRIGLRAVALYALAVALFVPQFGVALPDLVLSPGILATIGLASAVTGAALTRRRPDPWLLGIAAVTLITTAALEGTGRCVSGLNGGPGGATPLVAFTALGALLWRLRSRHGGRALALATLASAATALLVIASGAAWTTECASLYPAHDGLVAIDTLLSPSATRVRVPFWNHSAAGFFGLLPVFLGSLWLAVSAPWSTRGAGRGGGPAGLLGRHALTAYVGHLLVLGGLELFGLTPNSPLVTWALVAALVAAALGASAALEARRRGPLAPGTDPARPTQSRLPAGAPSVVASLPVDLPEEGP